MSAVEPLHILLATYNGARFLPVLLDSVLAQSDPNWVLLVRDDGSSDDTVTVLHRYAAHDARIRLMADEDATLGIRRNFERLLDCAHRAGAASFALCDQDDLWYPHKLARMRAALEGAQARHGGSTPILAYADLALIDDAGRSIAESHFGRAAAPQVRHGVDTWLIAHNLIPGCAMVGNRALLDLALPFPPQVFHHDWWLILVASAAGQVISVDAALTGYRQHSANAIGAAAPMSRILDFILHFRHSLEDARAQYVRAVDQAAALVERVGVGGHRKWIAAAGVARDRLGAPVRRVRIGAILAGPVRRIGLARNVLMFSVSLFPLRRRCRERSGAPSTR
ncbi:Glycosyl transferase [Aromatoleum aromaticum EbN1]|uniref:Glycosyl transferase n=1 Tax=Aromatoleum aromaticum (strain DSM 19018 / LMG 30748 / EbN1) TaxID=76114 RepID=Q5P6Q1_AROAE|nr:Glycosyl transferase [Aromatoleum aromaticum EbN1]